MTTPGSPTCPICVHPRVAEIEKLIRRDQPYIGVVTWMLKDNGERITRERVRRHRVDHMGLPPLSKSKRVPLPEQEVSPEALGALGRRALSVRLTELEAKDLLTLSIESMRLERAKYEAEGKKPLPEPPAPDGEPAAIEEARRARERLTRVS